MITAGKSLDIKQALGCLKDSEAHGSGEVAGFRVQPLHLMGFTEVL